MHRICDPAPDGLGISQRHVTGHRVRRVFTVKPTDVNSLPLYRCSMGGHHFDSVTDTCEGYPKEFQLGWVIA